MPKKPPTNKRAPPKSLAAKSQLKERQPQGTPAPPPNAPVRPISQPPIPTAANPYLDSAGGPIDFSSFVPPPSTVDPNDPNFPTALSNWSTTTLGKLNQLPSFSQSQLNAIAEAAVGSANKGNSAMTASGALPIDLPASLAALFEAKLTLDREKAKLLRMQKELKAHRENMHGVSNGKGKEVASEEQCECGRPHDHDDYPTSAHSGEHSDGYYYESEEEVECTTDCGCDCHHYHDDNEDGCGCEDCMAEQDEHDYHHHGHSHNHSHNHPHYHHGREEAYIREVENDLPAQQGSQLDIAEQVRNATVQLKNATAEANRASYKAESQQNPAAQGRIGPPPGQNLSQDPDRLDELVRELFNWIKAVVWTIEQAAVVAGRRNTWPPESKVD